MNNHTRLEGDVLLSIIIPVYNRQKSLNRLLFSLQSSVDYDRYEKFIELIIIDDASRDVVTFSFAGSVTLVKNNENMGAVVSRRRGYDLSVGKFVHFHDSDDGFSKDWLGAVVGLIINQPGFDVLLTGRNNLSGGSSSYKYQKYFHKYYSNPERLKKRLIYRNCMGPLGGVVFSRSAVSIMTFKSMASSQDWYMYIDVLDRAKNLVSRPDITYDFYIDGDDRISHDARKKVLGFLQLSRVTAVRSIFGRKIRLFYLHTCNQHVYAKGGVVKKLYKKHRLPIFFYYLIITLYWRFT